MYDGTATHVVYVYYMALRSANHTVIRVLNTLQCHMIHQLVWYAHFVKPGARLVAFVREVSMRVGVWMCVCVRPRGYE